MIECCVAPALASWEDLPAAVGAKTVWCGGRFSEPEQPGSCSSASLYSLQYISRQIGMDTESCRIERKENGDLLVRVASEPRNGVSLPDAVFTFRPGDPQYDRWLKKMNGGDGKL